MNRSSCSSFLPLLYPIPLFSHTRRSPDNSLGILQSFYGQPSCGSICLFVVVSSLCEIRVFAAQANSGPLALPPDKVLLLIYLSCLPFSSPSPAPISSPLPSPLFFLAVLGLSQDLHLPIRSTTERHLQPSARYLFIN